MSERLEKLHKRSIRIPNGLKVGSIALPGGIKGVAQYMGITRNTLHNWFSGNTNPTVDDLEALTVALKDLEAKAVVKKEQEEARLNALAV